MNRDTRTRVVSCNPWATLIACCKSSGIRAHALFLKIDLRRSAHSNALRPCNTLMSRVSPHPLRKPEGKSLTWRCDHKKLSIALLLFQSSEIDHTLGRCLPFDNLLFIREPLLLGVLVEMNKTYIHFLEYNSPAPIQSEEIRCNGSRGWVGEGKTSLPNGWKPKLYDFQSTCGFGGPKKDHGRRDEKSRKCHGWQKSSL